MAGYQSTGILVEAESFDYYGGWTLDSQWMLEMGSPYLLAHGNGKPVADAVTTVNIPAEGTYNVWVRAKDWVPGHHPGRFSLIVNDKSLDMEFGANDQDWNWESGGQIKLGAGMARLALHDLTGFAGRCDAIYLSVEEEAPPNTNDEASRMWRKTLLGLPETPEYVGTFDVVVVGGGIPGSTAAVAAARLGQRVALVQDRPVLGGNGSKEAGLRPRGVTGPLVDELTARQVDGDLLATLVADLEPNTEVFFEHTVFAASVEGTTIKSVDARHAPSGKEIRLTAPIFIDASGRALFGQLAGAETMSGRESRAEYGESLAPANRDNKHHGNTLFFRTKLSDKPCLFPEVPWATEVAKDFARLDGQLVKAGLDNGDGPVIGEQNPLEPRRMQLPMTHYWEYGQELDMYTNGEHIRDHLLRAIYGAFANVKAKQPDQCANLEFDHVAFVTATGEFYRYKGDYVVTENDIVQFVQFPDGVVFNGGPFCLHYGGHDKYDFRLKDWGFHKRGDRPYLIPFRSLYSSNISNLMMAGKHISVSHVAGSTTKFMGNGAQHAIACACAALLCKKYGTTPKGLVVDHIDELKGLCMKVFEDRGRNFPSKL